MTPAEKGAIRAQIVGSLAGEMAWERAQQPDPRGFRSNWSIRQRIAIHESGHGFAFTLFGRTPVYLEVRDPAWTPNGFTLYGSCSFVEAPHPEDAGPSDDEEAIALCKKLDPQGWEAVLADLQTITRELVADNWATILALGLELSFRGRLDRPEIERICKLYD